MQVISREILHSMIFAINNYYIGYTALNYKQKTEKNYGVIRLLKVMHTSKIVANLWKSCLRRLKYIKIISSFALYFMVSMAIF